jgi:peptidylprolyl isomerase
MKVPDLSDKIPALPAGSSCVRSLYTISTVPNVILSDVSPLASPTLRADLGIPVGESFSLGYVDSKVGVGAPAIPHKWYTIRYTGYLVDGTKFDSSYDPGHEPLSFLQGPGPQGRPMVVIGMDTGVDGMRVGGKRRLFIPYQLGYRAAGNPKAKIPPSSWLIFDIELVAQSDTAPAPKTPPAPPVSAAPKPAAAPTPAATPPAGTPPATSPGTTTPAAIPATPAPASTTPPASNAKPQ